MAEGLMDIQNALRVLSRAMPEGLTLEFSKNDLVTLADHTGNGTTETMRTQEMADTICRIKTYIRRR
jgi:hypothetical protein